MSLEIERKFLVEEVPVELAGVDSSSIRQGYLAAEGEVEVRLRAKAERRFLTVKRGAGLTRAEYEIEIDNRQFENLWPATAGCRLSKTRYRLPVGRYLVEVDVYDGALTGLITAEVEFESEAEAESFEPPQWFGVELTDDLRYTNRRLAVDGLPSR